MYTSKSDCSTVLKETTNKIHYGKLGVLPGINPSMQPVAHACNPSYSGGRDQEDHGWKPAPANSS
jgi:hypothetical protein